MPRTIEQLEEQEGLFAGGEQFNANGGGLNRSRWEKLRRRIKNRLSGGVGEDTTAHNSDVVSPKGLTDATQGDNSATKTK